MKTHYDRLANCAGYHKGDKVWLYRPTHMKRKLPKLQSSWEDLYKAFTQINDVVYRIPPNPHEEEIAQALILMGGLVQGIHPDK
jgi:hypothetical protein